MSDNEDKFTIDETNSDSLTLRNRHTSFRKRRRQRFRLTVQSERKSAENGEYGTANRADVRPNNGIDSRRERNDFRQLSSFKNRDVTEHAADDDARHDDDEVTSCTEDDRNSNNGEVQPRLSDVAMTTVLRENTVEGKDGDRRHLHHRPWVYVT